MVKLAAAILAGGKSTRMGQSKQDMILRDGRSMIEHVALNLRSVTSEIIISGETSVAALADLPRIADRVPDRGPLAGIEALLASGLADHYLVVSCDQPLFSPALALKLIEADPPACFRTSDGQELDPFPCLLPASALHQAQQFLNNGNRSVRRFIRSLNITWVDITPEATLQLTSMNTREDLERHGLL